MKKSEIKAIQVYFKKMSLYFGLVDGKRGEKTNQSINAYLSSNAAKLATAWPQWSEKRKSIASLQLICHEHGIDAGEIDGFYGPQTEASADRMKLLTITGELPRAFADIIPSRDNPHHFPVESYDDLIEYYGEPCDARLVKVTSPWVLRLDWDLITTTRTISIHEKLSESLSKILEEIYDTYGEEGVKQHGLDRYGGSFNCRKKRGSSSAWSTHAWGISIDWYPSKNKLRWDSDRASLAHTDLDPWWDAWEKEGWLSLGRTENRDWMHVQAAHR